MGKFISNLQFALRFLTRDIWRYTDEDVRGILGWLMNAFKAVWLSIRFFTAHRIMQRASALTYYTLLAVVPIFALILSIGRVLGIQSAIDQMLQGNANSVAMQYILQFADSYLSQAKNGIIIGVGLVVLLWVIYSLIGNVEDVFNDIWQQKKGRGHMQRIPLYLTLMILVPLGLLLSSGAQILLQTYLKTDIMNHELSLALQRVLRWAPYGLIILMFTLLYIVLPNCKVKFRNALTAGLVAGAGFIVFQGLYISGQIWVSKYNAIYGSFAALPLLLLWVQMSWIICLYGAELSYASQNIQYYNFENLEEKLPRQYRDFLLVLVAAVVYRRMEQGEAAPTTEEVSQELHLPAKITGELIRQLADLGIIRETVAEDPHQANNWTPGLPTDTCSVASLLELVSTTGEDQLKVKYKEQFHHEWQTFEAMQEAARKEGESMLLRDISFDKFKLSFTPIVKPDKKNKKKKRN